MQFENIYLYTSIVLSVRKNGLTATPAVCRYNGKTAAASKRAVITANGRRSAVRANTDPNPNLIPKPNPNPNPNPKP